MLLSWLSPSSATLPAQPGGDSFDRIVAALDPYRVDHCGVEVVAWVRNGIFGAEPASEVTFICDGTEHFGYYDPHSGKLLVQYADMWLVCDEESERGPSDDGPDLMGAMREWLAQADRWLRSLRDFLHLHGGLEC